ncbi:MAG: hypothetical protein K2N27_10270 [Ruminococcus sp.]|nr:hypothetical protein [Ruminococcus sp.]
MKVALGQIFRLAILKAWDNIINSSGDFSENPDDETLKILSGDIETYRQIKELANFCEHCGDVPLEEILCGYFEEEE